MINNYLGLSLSLAKKNFVKIIRENMLGFLWLILTPAIYSVFFLLVKANLSGESIGSEVSRLSALNAFCGLILAQCWFQSIQSYINLIRRNKGSLSAIDISLTPFALAALIETFVHLIIRIIIIFIVIFIAGQLDLSAKKLGIFGITFVVFLTTSLFIGLLLLPWATLYGDVRNALTSSLMPIVLISPVFYLPVNSSDTFLYWVSNIIPFSSVQANLSVMLFDGVDIYFNGLIFWLFLSIFLSIVSWRLVARQVPILLERIGA